MKILKDIFNDIKTYLPQYLSDKDKDVMLRELSKFPDNLDSRLYTNYLDSEKFILQGDCLVGFTVVNLPEKIFYESPAIIFSNTCDIDLSNKRHFLNSQICYAPIFSFNAYIQKIKDEKIKDEVSINSHIADIKKQRITQILFLPKGHRLPEDCIVFLDRLNNCSNKTISRENLKTKRLFVLSDYGFYLFLIKLSIHFTRIQEKVIRKQIDTIE